MAANLKEIEETFELLTEWDDRYEYITELGTQLPPMDDDHKNKDTQVHGCMSNVWVTGYLQDDKLGFNADCDTAVVKGLVALLVAIYTGLTTKEADELDADAIFDKWGLYEHISPNRHVGMYAMVERIRKIAREEV